MKNFIIILFSMLLLVNTALTQNCDSVANLSVDYTEDCKAVITWDMPPITSTDMLWNNTAGMANVGYLSSRWMLGYEERIIIADDFDIPSGVTWSIEEVTFRGFYLTQMGGVPPNYIGIEIYTDNGNKPGIQIYEDPYLTPNEWGFQGVLSVTLPEPFEISEAGKYWISIYGTYETAKAEQYQYRIILSTVSAGAPLHVYEYNNWRALDETPDFPSMYFSIKGSKEGETEPVYNIYRDGDFIATVVTETSYNDEEFDANQEHTWIVKMVCETGGESNPASISKESCIPQPPPPCLPVTDPKVTFSEKIAVIFWTEVEDAIEYKVSRDNNTTTWPTSPYIETFGFEYGMEYFWTIVTVCENGESEPVEVKATYTYQGIDDIPSSTFTVHPNPTTGELKISPAGGGKGVEQLTINRVEVFDIYGKCHLSLVTCHTSLVTLNISHLSAGLYFLRVNEQIIKLVKE